VVLYPMAVIGDNRTSGLWLVEYVRIFFFACAVGGSIGTGNLGCAHPCESDEIVYPHK